MVNKTEKKFDYFKRAIALGEMGNKARSRSGRKSELRTISVTALEESSQTHLRDLIRTEIRRQVRANPCYVDEVEQEIVRYLRGKLDPETYYRIAAELMPYADGFENVLERNLKRVSRMFTQAWIDEKWFTLSRTLGHKNGKKTLPGPNGETISVQEKQYFTVTPHGETARDIAGEMENFVIAYVSAANKIAKLAGDKRTQIDMKASTRLWEILYHHDALVVYCSKEDAGDLRAIVERAMEQRGVDVTQRTSYRSREDFDMKVYIPEKPREGEEKIDQDWKALMSAAKGEPQGTVEQKTSRFSGPHSELIARVVAYELMDKALREKKIEQYQLPHDFNERLLRTGKLSPEQVVEALTPIQDCGKIGNKEYRRLTMERAFHLMGR